ncbi:MAG: diguanylate cyclase [Spirochaetes bacterium]|nr:diguanylate cyclase [Spirochaetota bacterium]
MGLLERALEYKRRINEEGKETLIDRLDRKSEADIRTQSATSIQPTAEKINAIEIDEIESRNSELNNKQKDELENEKISEENEKREFLKEDIAAEDKSSALEDAIASLEDIVNLADERHNEDKNISMPDNNIPAADNLASERTEVENNLSNDKALETSNIESDIKDKLHDEIEEPDFNYYSMLYEIQKELINADTLDEIYSILIFSIMGQLGVSSVSIIIPSSDDKSKWVITDSYGIKISDSDINWRIDEGILKILNNEKNIIDLEDIKNEVSLRDDYYKFTSVDARLIKPLIENDLLIGAILIGEKISFEDFTSAEIEFLNELSQISSTKIELLAKQELVKSELIKLNAEREILSDIESFQGALLNTISIDELGKILQQNFYSLGIESYSIFMKDNLDGDYYPVQYDQKDNLGFRNSGFKIEKTNRLITFLMKKNASIMLEDFVKSVVVMDTFGNSRVANMDYFIACPFIIFGNLLGFVTIFKINSAVNISDIDVRIQKINRFLFPYLDNIYEADRSLNKYNDLTAGLHNKIKSEIQHACDLNISMSLMILTIKNYKVFYERFGASELEKLYNYIAEVLESKLNAGDFSAKIDRNRFLIVLPGKDKRYSIMLANLIKNDVVNKYSTSDFKLLITSLISVYPDDGADLFSILEVLE